MTQITDLIAALSIIPESFSLTPLIDKAPKRKDWQSEKALSKDELETELKSNRWTGYGLRLGNVSGGLVALDIDGSSAQPILDAMAKGDLPKTVSWTSNRVGRYQLLYQVPLAIQSQLSDFTKKDVKEFDGIKTEVGDDGKREQLEFRYNRVQSVLPPSKHPDTGSYVWINSPESTHVAEAPQWLCKTLLGFVAKPMKAKPAKKGVTKLGMTERDLVIAALNSIDPNLSYQDWLNVLMAGHSYDETLLDDFEIWSSLGESYKDGEVAQKWQSFKSSGSIQIGTLFFYAVEAGFKYPANLSNELTQWVKSQVLKHSDNQKTNFTPFVKRSIILEDLAEIDPEQTREEIAKISRHKNAWQFVRNRFPEDIADNIDFFSSRTGIKPEIYGLSFLTAVSSVLNGKFSVECFAGTEWYEPLNIFFVVIGEPGTNKSSPVKLLTQYHREKNAEYRNAHKEQQRQHDFNRMEYDTNKKDKISVGELPPVAPILKFASIGQATMEYLIQVMQTQQTDFNTGLLQYEDELITLLGALNKYNGGGDELGRFLSIWSGMETTTNTKSQGSIGTDKGCLSIVSTTQPITWFKMMQKLSDANGFQDRFLVGEVLKSDIKELNHFDHSVAPHKFDSLMKVYVDKFDGIDGKHVIKVSHSADYMKQAIETWVTASNVDLAKSKSYIYRLAAVFACLRDAQNPEIVAEDLDAAWKLVCYSEACKKSIGGTGQETLGEELVNRAKQLFIKKGELTVSNLKQSNRTMFGSLLKEEIHAVIYQVANQCADTSELTTTKQGSPKLLHIEAKAVNKLEKDFAKVIEPQLVTPVVEPTVELEPIVEPIDIKQVDNPIEAELECIHTGHIHIPTKILATRYQSLATPNQQYRLIEESKDYYSIDIPGADKIVKVHKSKLVYNL